jgi:hypothetical protein
MPRVYRIMKVENGVPKLGDAAMCLGTRPGEIPVDPDGNVHPGTGGLSVYDSIASFVTTMLPRRLHPRFPGARNSNSLAVWATGTGPFVSGPLTDSLALRVDESDDPRHGFIEPRAIMKWEDYVEALAQTLPNWAIDEQ